MEDRIKQIVSPYIRVNESDIHANTSIARRAFLSSIQMHRMYAQLLDEGFDLDTYESIETFGDLIRKISKSGKQNEIPVSFSDTTYSIKSSLNDEFEIGIDLQSVEDFETVADFRTDPFYQSNFTSEEISYCILQPNPLESFAGLFAAKEAIFKADENLMKIKPAFNQINITHTITGKPTHPRFQISISHSKLYAVAAVAKRYQYKESTQMKDLSNQKAKNINTIILYVLALLNFFLIIYLYSKL